MIEYMVDFLSRCPVIGERRINVNYLDSKSRSFSLESVPCQPVLRSYADGAMLCERRYNLAMRRESSLSSHKNLNVARECEEIENWIQEQMNRGQMPYAGDNAVAVSLEIIKNFGVVQTASMDMRFEAVLRFVFYVE